MFRMTKSFFYEDVKESFAIPSVDAKYPWDAVDRFDPLDDIQEAKCEAKTQCGISPDSIYLPILAEGSFMRAIKTLCYTEYRDAFESGIFNEVVGMKIVRKLPTNIVEPWKVFVYADSEDELEIIATMCIIKNATITHIENMYEDEEND